MLSPKKFSNGVKLYDTTLRDGAQSKGISFSLEDKLKIAKKLSEIGVHYIEGGWPGSNPKDISFFKEVQNLNLGKSKIAAFTSTRRANTKAEEDVSLRRSLESQAPVVTIFGKSWKLHITDVLKTTEEENLKMIEESVRFFKKHNKEVIYDAEHFFDGFKNSSSYALKTLKAAVKGGADCVVLCDTNGGALPSQIVSITKKVKEEFNCKIGIHTHNDNGMAVANSIIAIENGVTHIQGTVNGLGERCGNADLITIIPNLQLKMGIKCLTDENLAKLTELSLYIDEIANLIPMNNQPFVGENAFAHKGGMHVDAVKKNTVTFEHINPVLVGNKRKILASELSGKSTIFLKAKEMGINLDEKDPKIINLLNKIKELEHAGYHFEAAEASFELLIKRNFAKYKKFFQVEGYDVHVYLQKNKLSSEATIRAKVDGQEEHTASLGDGPVDALTNALKKALIGFYPSLTDFELIDYKVRIINPEEGTAAKTRVLIQFRDHKSTWSTIGVSTNIIEASWEAVVDAIEYKLLKDQEEK
ncbi:MAG: citramalate synthase [Candidatus Omnitrophota bacterium]